MERLLHTLETLTAEGASLTLLNVDLIPDHICQSPGYTVPTSPAMLRNHRQ
jgi:hypothetical protein